MDNDSRRVLGEGTNLLPLTGLVYGVGEVALLHQFIELALHFLGAQLLRVERRVTRVVHDDQLHVLPPFLSSRALANGDIIPPLVKTQKHGRLSRVVLHLGTMRVYNDRSGIRDDSNLRYKGDVAVVTARKEHECYWCPDPINKGERHVVEVAWDYQRTKERYHVDCYRWTGDERLLLEQDDAE